MTDSLTIKRNWDRIEQHLRAIDARDVECHESGLVVKRRLAFVAALEPYLPLLGINNVLDVGAAGITRQWWLDHIGAWRGLCFPRDYEKLRAQEAWVDLGDVASMPYLDGAFDLVYASHVLEHSVMPLIALRECARVGRALAMAVPGWPRLVEEPYHYAVVPKALWGHWLDIAGWRIAADFTGGRDYLFLCTQNDADFNAVRPVYEAWRAARTKRCAVRAAKRRRR